MINIEEIARFFNDNADFHDTVKQNESLKNHTTMHVGGKAKMFLEPSDAESLVLATRILIEEKIDFFILGGGSNVVISDSGLDAVISTRKMNRLKRIDKKNGFHSENYAESAMVERVETTCKSGRAFRHAQCPYLDSSSIPLNPSESPVMLQVDSGASWGSVISFCKKNNLGGFEGFTGLSGTVGGALFMNATCFGLSACDNLVSVEYFDTRDFQIHTYEKNDSDWGYKVSPFQSGEKIILSAVFRVTEGFDSQKSENCLASRKEKGHFRSPSAGSAFKNDAANGVIAGKVIDECGLKGFSVGGAQIAPWHGNFIINPNRKATASDIKNLSDEVKKIVREKTGILLESEILFIGF